MIADRMAAIVILLVAVQYMLMARAYHGVTVADTLGPSAYPYVIGGLMALMSLLLLIQSKPRPAGEPFWARHGKPVLLAASLYAYIRLLEPLGFLLSTFAFITFGHAWLGERSWPRAAGLAAAIAVTLWYLFNRVFALNLPAGFLGWPR
ncbi:tripartite tricarboxylate transporter TctB family protein [candidate division WOR-3 bacterium]|nr:tripartite tricarboxylate transporter TctB family protein [candidate division WOR-3 bacterium]